MKNKIGIKGVFFCFLLVGIFLINNSVLAEDKAYQVRLFFFGTPTCPHCQAEKEFLPTLEEKYPNLEVQYFDVSGFKGRKIFTQVSEEYNLSGGVPVTIIGDDRTVGFDNAKNIGKKIENRVKECSLNACESKLEPMLGLPSINKTSIDIEKLGLEVEGEVVNNNQDHVHNKDTKVSVFGKEICAEDLSSPCILGVVLGLADGINPCMFSVLFFVLSYLLAIGSQKRALKAGIAFVVTTFFVYFLFMYGIIQIVDLLGVAGIARIFISVIAFLIGLIMIKDFFFYGKFVSLEIPKSVKPTLEKLVKKGTIPSAIFLAILASIVELPCTSGLPLAYISVLAEKDVSYFWYIALYNLFFILPLIVIIALVVFFEKKTEELENWRKSSRKYMRLVGGLLLLLLSLALCQNWV
ncbi:MAG: hypothetical protein PF549_02240 [Patescibacteria group bacterium]|jgi:cytochrome c biogenesis protein CcdA/glutaredoxin|nr:hypothetical protein [Patescibacteria group bacterium]